MKNIVEFSSKRILLYVGLSSDIKCKLIQDYFVFQMKWLTFKCVVSLFIPCKFLFFSLICLMLKCILTLVLSHFLSSHTFIFFKILFIYL